MPKDPTLALREMAAAFRAVEAGTSCNQAAFKTGKKSFLFVGPGAQGRGYKAMFKLGASIPQAQKLAAADPERFQVGSTHWVTVRFSSEAALPKSIWSKWLKESYALNTSATPRKKA